MGLFTHVTCDLYEDSNIQITKCKVVHRHAKIDSEEYSSLQAAQISVLFELFENVPT